MPNKKQIDKNKNTAKKLYNKVSTNKCPECGQKTLSGHFIMPCLGEKGFWVCDKFYKDGVRI